MRNRRVKEDKDYVRGKHRIGKIQGRAYGTSDVQEEGPIRPSIQRLRGTVGGIIEELSERVPRYTRQSRGDSANYRALKREAYANQKLVRNA